MKKEEERQRQTSGLCKVKKDIQGESETRMNSRMERNETEKTKKNTKRQTIRAAVRQMRVN